MTDVENGDGIPIDNENDAIVPVDEVAHVTAEMLGLRRRLAAKRELPKRLRLLQ